MGDDIGLNLRNVSDEEIPTWAHLTATTLQGVQSTAEEVARQFAQAPEDSRSISFLAWHGDRAVARLRLRISGDQASSWGIGLIPEARDLGLERALPRAIEARACAAAAARLAVVLEPSLVNPFVGAGYRVTKSRIAMRARLEHRPVVCNRPLRRPLLDDGAEVQAIGRLYYAAYLNTIDYEGEPLEEAHAEVQRSLDGYYGDFLAGCSFVLEGQERSLAGMTMVTKDSDNTVLLAEVMVHPDYRGQGYARPLIQASMNACLEQGFADMVLTVTLGNVPAEGLYRRMGFVAEPEHEYHHLEKSLGGSD